jgi:hypothetical protein
MTGIRNFRFDSKEISGKTIYKEIYDHLNFNSYNLKQKARLPIPIRNNRKSFV